MLAACFAALAPCCHKASAPRAQLHCFQTDGSKRHDGQGLNPLIGTFVSCFDDAPACEVRAKAEATECSATLPRWHCYSLLSSPRPANDPLDGMTFCYPSLALCNAARTPSVALVDDPPLRSPCKPADTVYCETSGPLRCAASEVLCNRAGEMSAAVLSGSQPHARCVARHSVR